jgi:hypothetical protein
MRAVHNYAYLAPAGAVALVEIPEPGLPGQFQVLVGMDFSYISRDDFHLLSGSNGKRCMLPCVAGCSGLGTVLKIGRDVENVRVGQRVMLSGCGVTWADRLIVQSEELVPLVTRFNGCERLKGLPRRTPAPTDKGESENIADHSMEFLKLLYTSGAGIEPVLWFPKVVPLWEIKAAIAYALSGYQVFLSFHMPTSDQVRR